MKEVTVAVSELISETASRRSWRLAQIQPVGSFGRNTSLHGRWVGDDGCFQSGRMPHAGWRVTSPSHNGRRFGSLHGVASIVTA
jgi:hypothetical protein